MELTIKQYLKFYSKYKEGRIKLRKLFQIAKNKKDITEIDYWILIYSFAECRMVENTCAKIGISKTTYHNILNVALVKIENVVKKYDNIWTL